MSAGDDTSRGECPVCEEWKEDIEEHIRTEHPNPAPDDLDRLKEEFTAETVRNLGVESDGSTRETTCKICGESIESTRGEHLAEHLDEPDAIESAYSPDILTEIQEEALGTEANGGAVAESTNQTSASEGSTPDEEEQTPSREAPDPSDSGKGPDANTHDDERDVAGKWFVFGIGGAGNGILDSLLMRRRTLRDQDDPLSGVWGSGGINGYWMLNSNDSEVWDTYYTQTDQELDEDTMITHNIIGDGRGFGDDPFRGSDITERIITEDDFFDRISLAPEYTKQANATLFCHSVERGTGTGMTPKVAQFLRDEGEWGGDDRTLASVAILPNDAKEGAENAVYGLSQLARPLDVILMFQNKRLREQEFAQADIDFDLGPEGQKLGHEPENEVLVRFLEGLTVTSNSGVDVRGDGFDVTDAYQPIEKYIKGNESDDDAYKPAPIAAPVLAGNKGESTEGTVEQLVFQAINHGRLVEFDPATAWGGAFLIFGPPDMMQVVNELTGADRIEEMIKNAAGLDEDERYLKLNVKSAESSSFDQLYIIGLMWNPVIPDLDDMRAEAEYTREQFSDRDIGELLNQCWDEVDALFENLGGI